MRQVGIHHTPLHVVELRSLDSQSSAMSIAPYPCVYVVLFSLATCGHQQICRTLIENGAEMLALNAEGNMPYDICDDEATLD